MHICIKILCTFCLIFVWSQKSLSCSQWVSRHRNISMQLSLDSWELWPFLAIARLYARVSSSLPPSLPPPQETFTSIRDKGISKDVLECFLSLWCSCTRRGERWHLARDWQMGNVDCRFWACTETTLKYVFYKYIPNKLSFLVNTGPCHFFPYICLLCKCLFGACPWPALCVDCKDEKEMPRTEYREFRDDQQWAVKVSD